MNFFQATSSWLVLLFLNIHSNHNYYALNVQHAQYMIRRFSPTCSHSSNVLITSAISLLHVQCTTSFPIVIVSAHIILLETLKSWEGLGKRLVIMDTHMHLYFTRYRHLSDSAFFMTHTLQNACIVRKAG